MVAKPWFCQVQLLQLLLVESALISVWCQDQDILGRDNTIGETKEPAKNSNRSYHVCMVRRRLVLTFPFLASAVQVDRKEVRISAERISAEHSTVHSPDQGRGRIVVMMGAAVGSQSSVIEYTIHRVGNTGLHATLLD
jgi:hypothetical protein